MSESKYNNAHASAFPLQLKTYNKYSTLSMKSNKQKGSRSWSLKLEPLFESQSYKMFSKNAKNIFQGQDIWNKKTCYSIEDVVE